MAGDTVAMEEPYRAVPPVVLRDMATGSTRMFEGLKSPYQSAFGSVVAVGYNRGEFSLADTVGGEQRIRPVTGFPDAGDGPDSIGVTTGDARGAVVRYDVSDVEYRLGYLDFTTATVTEAFSGLGQGELPEMLLDDERIGWYDPASSKLHPK